jgi:HSP20 family protein
MRMLTPYWVTRGLSSDLFSEMERFFNDYDQMMNSQPLHEQKNFLPACEIAESDDHYLMSLDLPGVKKDDIKIEIADNVLSISGERKRESQLGGADRAQSRERSFGAFKRDFRLPASLDADKIEARYEHGVLELYLPKTQAARPRQIEIQAEKGGIFSKLLGAKKAAPEEVGKVNSSQAS